MIPRFPGKPVLELPLYSSLFNRTERVEDSTTACKGTASATRFLLNKPAVLKNTVIFPRRERDHAQKMID